MNQTNYKIYRYFLFTLLLFIFASVHLFAQENTTVTGKIIDAKHKTPLEGASISIGAALPSMMCRFTISLIGPPIQEEVQGARQQLRPGYRAYRLRY